MHYVVLYPQNGDRIVTIDSVTSLHPVYGTACQKLQSAVFMLPKKDAPSAVVGTVRK